MPDAANDSLEVRCPECGVDASRLLPCLVCGHRSGCCRCVHADETGVDIARLREVANAATEGPWLADVLGSEGYAIVPDTPPRPARRRTRVARCGYEDWDTDKANAEHIAAFDPPTVLALLSELEQLRAVVERVRAVDHTLRRLGMAFPDPWREGWNRALEVVQDDLRLAIKGEVVDD